MTNSPLIRDESRHQGIVNPQVQKDNDVQMVIIRATISWAYRDPFYVANWEGTGNVGMLRAPYHVLYPGEDTVRQMDNWYAVQDTIEGVPRVLDSELQHELEDEAVGEAIMRASEVVKARDGFYPLQYSRRMLLALWQKTWTDEEVNQFYYHLAQYYSDGQEHGYADGTELLDLLPSRINRDRVLIHQTSDVLPGFPGEAQSLAVDTNRGVGHFDTVDKMHAFIASKWGGSTPPVPDPTYEEGVLAGEKMAYNNVASFVDGELLKRS